MANPWGNIEFSFTLSFPSLGVESITQPSTLEPRIRATCTNPVRFNESAAKP